MDIRDYKYIVTIAEQKSITRAAAQLYYTVCSDQISAANGTKY